MLLHAGYRTYMYIELYNVIHSWILMLNFPVVLLYIDRDTVDEVVAPIVEVGESR